MYEVGDMVVVRRDLTAWEDYPDDRGQMFTAFDDFIPFRGKTVEIVSAYNNGVYKIKGSIYYWPSGMFEGLSDYYHPNHMHDIDEQSLNEVLHGIS